MIECRPLACGETPAWRHAERANEANTNTSTEAGLRQCQVALREFRPPQNPLMHTNMRL